MNVKREVGSAHEKLNFVDLSNAVMGRISKLVMAKVLFATVCAATLPFTATASSTATANLSAMNRSQPGKSEAERLLAIHNAERARLGLPELRWNAALARDANAYARVLLDRGALQHSSITDRNGHGENLWMGTAGVWNPDAMIGMFLDERRYYRHAAFPDVSLTGNWSDVGHYTQVVWKDTREVGCAIDSGKGMDVLVCRYSPAGNVLGKSPF